MRLSDLVGVREFLSLRRLCLFWCPIQDHLPGRKPEVVLDGESNALANPEDDHTKGVFDPEIRGKTDRFVLRVRKPE